MDLRSILNKHQGHAQSSPWNSHISLSTGNSSAVARLIDSLSMRALLLIRTLHLELVIDAPTMPLNENLLLNHIDASIEFVTGRSYSALKYDRNMELGFSKQKKMKGLFEVLKWKIDEDISSEELSCLYSQWLETYNIPDLLSAQSSQEINEVFTFFLILEEGQGFQVKLIEKVKNNQIEMMIFLVSNEFNKALLSRWSINSEWISLSESLFRMLDEEENGHIDAESVQFLVLALLLPESKIEPVLARKQVYHMLQDMSHSNGLITLRCWKSYLLSKNMNSTDDLRLLQNRLHSIIEIWREVRNKIFTKEIPALSKCTYLATSKQELPSIWNQAIMLSLSSSLRNWERLYKFLRFSGWLLGSTPTLSTKGQCFIQGTYIQDSSEFSLYLMSNYLELEGQFHTSVAINCLTQQSLTQVAGDPRFQAILKTIQTYDKLIGAILGEIISAHKATISNNEPAGPPTIPISIGNIGKCLEAKPKISETSENTPTATRKNSEVAPPVRLKTVRTSPTLIPSRNILMKNSSKANKGERSAVTPNRLERNRTEISVQRASITPNRLERNKTEITVQRSYASITPTRQAKAPQMTVRTKRSSTVTESPDFIQKQTATPKLEVNESIDSKTLQGSFTDRNTVTPTKLSRQTVSGTPATSKSTKNSSINIRSITPTKSSISLSIYSSSKTPIKKVENYDEVMKRLSKK